MTTLSAELSIINNPGDNNTQRGSVFSRAFNHVAGRVKHYAHNPRALRNMALDAGMRWATVGQLRLVVSAAVLGAGMSSVAGIAAATAVSALGTASYTYLKDYAADVLEARRQGGPWRDVRFFDKKRLLKSRSALLAGALGGVIGAGIMAGLQTDIAQSAINTVQHTAGDVLARAGDGLATLFNKASAALSGFSLIKTAFAATAIPPSGDGHGHALMMSVLPDENNACMAPEPAPAPLSPAETLMSDPDHPPLQSFYIPEDPTAPVVENSSNMADVPLPVPNALERVQNLVETIDHPRDGLKRALRHVIPGDLDATHPQILTNVGVQLMHQTDIPLADRLAAARDLLEEAAARGNTQAPRRLAELATLNPETLRVDPFATAQNAAPAAAPGPTPPPSPTPPVPRPVPVSEPAVPAAPDVPEETGTEAAEVKTEADDMAQQEIPVQEVPAQEVPVQATAAPEKTIPHDHAITCAVSGDDPSSLTTTCETHKEEVKPGDGIVCYDAAHPEIYAEAVTSPGSSTLKAAQFQHPDTVFSCMKSLQGLKNTWNAEAERVITDVKKTITSALKGRSLARYP